MDPVGDPAAIRAKADELRHAARALETVFSAVTNKVDDTVFEGPAAERWRAGMRRQRTDAERSYATLIEVAARLDSTAAAIEAEIHARRIAELRRLEEEGRRS